MDLNWTEIVSVLLRGVFTLVQLVYKDKARRRALNRHEKTTGTSARTPRRRSKRNHR